MRPAAFARTALLLLATCFSTVGLALAQPAASAAPAAAAIDRGYITPNAVLAAVAHPRRVLTAPEMEFLPREIISAAGLKELGLDPAGIDELLAVAELPDFQNPPLLGLVLHFNEPLQQGGLLPELVKRTTRAELNGKGYRKAISRDDFSLMRVDPQTILVASDELLGKMLANVAKPQAGPAAKALGRMSGAPDAAVVVALDPIRPMLKAELQKAPVPPAFANFLTIPDLIVSAEAQAALLDCDGSLVLHARDEEAAKQLENMLNALLDMGKMGLQVHAARMASSPDPVEQAAAQYMQRISGRMIDMFRPVREGDHLKLSGKGLSSQAGVLMLAATAGFLTDRVRADSPRPMPPHAVPVPVHKDVRKAPEAKQPLTEEEEERQ
jgi:hypothetical protein